MGENVSQIEFDRYVVSGSIICDCGQHHIFLGAMYSGTHVCERCGRLYRLVPPRLTVVQVECMDEFTVTLEKGKCVNE